MRLLLISVFVVAVTVSARPVSFVWASSKDSLPTLWRSCRADRAYRTDRTDRTDRTFRNPYLSASGSSTSSCIVEDRCVVLLSNV